MGARATKVTKGIKMTKGNRGKRGMKVTKLTKRGELYENRMVFNKSSTKAGWLSLKAQRKQDGFH